MGIEVITKGLKENPEVQKDGMPYFPKEWSKEFKPVLGAYRKFVERCSAFIVKAGDIPTWVTVHSQNDKSAANNPGKQEWELKLAKTWGTYMHNVKKDDRKPEEFVEYARQLAFQSTGRMDGDSKRHKKRRKEASSQAKKDGSDDDDDDDDDEPPKKKPKGRDGPNTKKKKKAAVA